MNLLRAFQASAAILLATMSLEATATSPRYEPPTLEQKVKDSNLIVVARVGRVMYVQWPDGLPPRRQWNISDLPTEGAYPYLNLLEYEILLDKSLSNDMPELDKQKSLPLWTQLIGCFPRTKSAESYPPSNEVRIFLLGRRNLASDHSLQVTACKFPSLPIADLSELLSAIRATRDARSAR